MPSQTIKLSGGKLTTAPAPVVKPPVTPTTPAPVPVTSTRKFGVLGVNTTGPMSDLIDAGCNVIIIPIFWNRIMPTRNTVNQNELNKVLAKFAAARAAGASAGRPVQIVVELCAHYPPDYVLTGVPMFTDQKGNKWSADTATGENVRDWFTQAIGRTMLAEFVGVLDFLPLLNSDIIRLGNSYRGELSYPAPDRQPDAPAEPQFWCWNAVTATGRASDISDPPSTDTSSTAFLDWCESIPVAFIVWMVNEVRKHVNCRLYVMHPGWQKRQGVDADKFRTQTSWGIDVARQMDAYGPLGNVYPWCTWIDGPADMYSQTSPQSRPPWKNLLAEAKLRGLDAFIMGENTSETSGPDVLQRVLSGPVAAGYGLVWLNYAGLTNGSGTAVQLSQLSAAIKSI